ncbi:MAG: helix-turn-helix domain-containing protein [Panacibacter sp.]
METLNIPNENDFKRWVKEALKEYLQDSFQKGIPNEQNEDALLNRKEIAKFLRISLVTLTDWMKRGLPSHKQRGRVYFVRSEVLDYIKTNRLHQFKFGNRFSEINT